MALFQFLLDILFPPRCAFCKKEGDFLCEFCRSNMDIKAIRSQSNHPSVADFTYLDGVIYGADYAKNPALKAAVSQFKYRFTKDLTDDFSRILADKIAELSMAYNKKIILIPVPLHKKRLNYRGFNQAELIAQAVAERVGDRVSVLSLLRRVRHTSQQAKLSKRQRLDNLSDAFVFLTGDHTPDSSVIYFVVDDVCTTGSTLDNCAKILKEAGFSKIYGLVVARAFK
jgi:ComF family protein